MSQLDGRFKQFSLCCLIWTYVPPDPSRYRPVPTGESEETAFPNFSMFLVRSSKDQMSGSSVKYDKAQLHIVNLENDLGYYKCNQCRNYVPFFKISIGVLV